MPIAAVLARAVYQPVDLALGEIAPLDCQVYDAWGAFLGCRFHADKLCLRASYRIGLCIFCTVVKGGATAWSASRSQCRMEAPERARSMATRAARPTSFCLAAEPLYGTPGGGLFGFKFCGRERAPLGGGRSKIENSSRLYPRKFGQKRFLAVRRSRRKNGVACFWATSWEKIFGGVIAIISFRPGGWMQQSAVPRCAILSVRSTGGIGQ